MNWSKTAAATAVFAALLCVSAPPAQAGTKKVEDAERGFKLKIDDDFNQVPPKLGQGAKHVVGEFYIDKAKFARTGKPTIMMMWFPRVKAGPVTPSAEAAADGKKAEGEATEVVVPDRTPKSTYAAIDPFLRRNARAFGKFMPLAQRRVEVPKSLSQFKTKSKHVVDVIEINAKKVKKKQKQPGSYALVAKFEIERPADIVEVGFVCYCRYDDLKKYRKVFKRAIESFTELADASNTRGLGKGRNILEMDPEEFVQHVIKNKVIEGWSYHRTDHYLLLFSDEVKKALVQDIAKQVEVLRKDIYEEMFPADKEVKAISVIRICKDKAEYVAYGGPGGSAGYWSWPSMELVFYAEKPAEDSLRVLYHEAFHQYIFYSVGDFSPHSWFNEGNGDFFSGHSYKNGKFKLGKFSWRASSKTDKKKHFGRGGLTLAEWLTWTKGKYYGGNERRIPGGTNYAMGWDFIYFLRTTRKKEYQQILPTYFDVLKTQVTTLREQLIKEAKAAAKEAGEEYEIDAGELREAIMKKNADFLDLALKEAFKGIDLTELQEDWLDN